MTFPDRMYADARTFAEAYFAKVAAAAASVDAARREEAAGLLTRVHRGGGVVFSCGNGGSAAIANHLVCDHCKSVQTDTDLIPRISSLSSTMEVVTAIANDLSYEDVFVYQLRSLARPGDALVHQLVRGLRKRRPCGGLGKGSRHSGDRHDRLLGRPLLGPGRRRPARGRRQLRGHRGRPPVAHAHPCAVHPAGAHGRTYHSRAQVLTRRSPGVFPRDNAFFVLLRSSARVECHGAFGRVVSGHRASVRA
jgi:hypothetical protein